MKALSNTPSLHGCSIGVVNALLSVVFTVLSFQYVQPQDCYRFCNSEPCPPGSCRFGEQKAGWPLPVFVDDPGGGSPTSGWGIIGPEDPALFIPLLLDILFYSLFVWLFMLIILIIWRRKLPVRVLWMSLLLNLLFAVSLWFFSWMFGAPIGHGQSIHVYMDTPVDAGVEMAFFPNVPLSVEEMIQTVTLLHDL